jgi:hypothetical protein
VTGSEYGSGMVKLRYAYGWNSRLGSGEKDDVVFELLGSLLSSPVVVWHDTF